MFLGKKAFAVCLFCSTTLSESVLAEYTKTVDTGTVVRDELIDDNGGQSVRKGGTTENTTINAGSQSVYGTSNNTNLTGEGRTIMLVYGGGVANGTTVANKKPDNGISLLLVADGTANKTTLSSGGVAQIGYEKGGTRGAMNDTTLLEGSSLYNMNGVDTNTVVHNGAVLEVGNRRNEGLTSKAESINATINSGGRILIDNGGKSTGATVNAGGVMVVTSRVNTASDGSTSIGRGSAVDSIISGIMKNTGGIDINTTVKSGGLLELSNDAVSTGATIESGGHAQLGAAVAEKWTIEGLVQGLNSRSNFKETTVGEMGILEIQKGSAADSIVHGAMVNSGGTDTNTVVKAGGLLQVKGDATSTGATIEADGGAQLSGNAVAEKWTIQGQVESTSSTVTLNNTTIGDTGLLVLKKGKATDSIVHGAMNNTGGTDINTIVKAGGLLKLSGNVTSTEATIEANGTAQLTEKSLAENWTIQGQVESVDDTVTLNNTTIGNTGLLLLTKGKATDSIVQGTMSNTGGTDTNTTVKAGGLLQLSADAISKGATIEAEGAAQLFGKALADQWNIQGQVESLSADAILNNATIADTGSLQLGNGSLKGTLNTQGQVFIYNDAKTAEADITQTKGDIHLINNSNDHYDFELNSLNMNQGRVSFGGEATTRATSAYSTLNLNSLEGSGEFFMRTNIAGLQGDFLNVSGIANGNFNIMVADSGVNPLSDDSLSLVQIGGGNAQFNLINPGQVVDLGTYQYELQADDKGGWSLIPSKRATITPSASAVISSASIDPLVFQAEMNSIQGRMEEVRSFSHDSNLWIRAIGNNYNISDANHDGYDINTSGMVVGIDGTIENSQVTTTRGLFVSYSNSKVDFNRGGSSQINAYSLGAYTSSLYTNGFYWDAVLKANRFNSDISARMSSGGGANGDYHNMGLGLNLEAGKYYRFDNSYITPYVGLTTFISQGKKYHLSNGMQANMGAQRSAVGEVGVKMGRTFKLLDKEIQPYIKLAVSSEFLDNPHVRVNGDKFKSDLSGARGTVETGANLKLGESINLHIDAAYTGSSRVESPWGANVGVSWSF